MTTLTTPRPAGAPAPLPPDEPSSSRLARWRASWRVALRMAKRDAWRYKGRSLLVLCMVALPVGMLVGTLTFATSSSAAAVDRIPTTLGTAAAMLATPTAEAVHQLADPDRGWTSGSGETPPRATPIPGYDTDTSPGSAENVAALQKLTGGKVVPVGTVTMRRVIDDKRSRAVQVMSYDTSVDLGPKAELVSGRWPTGSNQVVATPFGISRGMPSSGTTELRANGVTRTVTVVGVANVFDSWSQPDAVSEKPVVDEAEPSWQYLLMRDQGVPYSEVKQLNTYGLLVTSAETLRHPPSRAELPPEFQTADDYQAREVQSLVAVGGILLLVVTTLLVAPAFAVSASRQRRTLALAASNGAETRQLRRKVLAQALVLGVLSAVTSAALALVALRVLMAVLVQVRPWTTFRYFSVSWWGVGAVIAMAVISALVAALIPALRLKRLDIVGVMKGQSVSPGLNRVLPVVGGLLAAGGGSGLVWAVANKQSDYAVVGTALVLVLGSLLLVPAMLVAAGHLASRLPFAPRMATRDAARHRTRSVPTVAAVMAGAIALTTFSIAIVSDTEQQRRAYLPQHLPGEGQMYVAGEPDPVTGMPRNGAVESAEATVRSLAPNVRTTRLGQVTSPYSPTSSSSEPSQFVAAVPPGCSLETTLTEDESRSSGDGRARCQLLGTNARTSIAVLPAAEAARLLKLSPTDSKTLGAGGIAVADARLLDGGAVALTAGTTTADPNTGEVTKISPARTDKLPAVVAKLPVGQFEFGGVVTPETARKLGWPVSTRSLLLHDPDGPITEAAEKAVSEQAGDEGGVYVERGFQRDDKLFMQIMFGAFGLLLLIVTLISTALALAEQQGDMGTLAAVGATKGTRRRMAAAQSATVAFIGVCVGIAVGLPPGIAMTYPLTSRSWDPETGVERVVDPTTVIPWLPLALVAVAVPVVAALLSAAAIRKAPGLTRRAE